MRVSMSYVTLRYVQDVGVAHLCDGLCDQTGEKGLKTLVLFNNQLTYQAMSSLAKVLVRTIFNLVLCNMQKLV